MKTFLLIVVGLLAAGRSSWAQDTLVTRHGEAIVVKVSRITPQEIEYKHFDNPDGPLIVVLKSGVAAIRYANGTREAFNADEPAATSTPVITEPAYALPTTKKMPLVQGDLYVQGQMDAQMYYRKNGALWGTAITTFLIPPAGLIVGVATGASRPSPGNFFTPNPELLREPEYLRGYQKQAHRRKAGKAASGFGLGLGALVLFIAVFSN